VKNESIRVATFTLSDTRTVENDEGGRLLGELLRAARFNVVSHSIVREDPDALREAVIHTISLNLSDAIVTTGGTGVTPRDRTIDTLAPMMQKNVEGFGEAFRRLSWEEVGPNAILSRAAMGVIRNRVVIALPGSVNAVRLGTEKLIVPTLAHAVALANGEPDLHTHLKPKPKGS
jgi:molybdenum cofactor biosynthesis protein B